MMTIVIPSSTRMDREHQLNSVLVAQHGVIGVRQLNALGFTSEMLMTRVLSGRLVRVHRGVYAVAGAPLSSRGRWMAAVLHAGDDACLTSATALEFAQCLRRPRNGISVVTAGTPRSSDGYVLARTRWMPDSHRSVRDGIRSVCVERAIVDWARTADPYELVEAMYEGEFRRRFSIERLSSISQRLCNAPGRAAVRFAMDQYRAGARGPFSNGELFFLRIVREAGLPTPFANAPVETPRGTYIVDAVWPRRRCCVEVDERHGHGRTGAAFADVDRTEALAAGGYRLLRVDTALMHADPDRIVSEVASLLGL